MLIDLADVDLAPFRTNQINTIVSFSGGRTSGVMLWHVLKAHDWNLPENVKVVFENTGKEREETLDFVHEVETRWGVDINWIEWRLEKPRFRRVNYETASRNGEPFAELIEWKGNYLPGPVQRMCTQHLKVDCMRHFIRSELQWDEWQSFIGIRADEPRRWRVENSWGAEKSGRDGYYTMNDSWFDEYMFEIAARRGPSHVHGSASVRSRKPWRSIASRGSSHGVGGRIRASNALSTFNRLATPEAVIGCPMLAFRDPIAGFGESPQT